MKKILKIVSFVFIAALIIIGCDEFNEITTPYTTGSANFSKFVTIGNSLTAGYQSAALFESAQMYSYGNQIAIHMNTLFAQPLYSDPGTGGRMEVVSISPFVSTFNQNVGAPTNLTYPAPYNNLGIPGALLYDVLNATNANDCASAIFAGKPNPMFDLILRNSALNLGTQIQQATVLDPTLVTLWIGNNDVLGFATSGGTSPSAPTDVPTFTALYNLAAGALASLNANVVVANLPDVTTLPFFTTVGPTMALSIPWGTLAALGAPGVIYQKHGGTIGTGVADSLSLLTGVVMVTLPGGSYAGLIGTPTGKFYKDNNYPGLPAGIDTTMPFGVHPQNPWPDALILDADEILTAQSTNAAFNNVILTAANSNGFGYADMVTIMNELRVGKVINGVSFSTMYITGGVFSLDGVHPSNQGQAIIANEFITAINAKFGANIPLIDVSSIPGSLVFAKSVSFDRYGYPNFTAGAFDHLFF
jgi:lysophospholipase L1-like esterase